MHKAFGEVEALRGLDLTVASGRITGFLGSNGAGKTTTLRILMGLSQPDAGEARVLGTASIDHTPELRRRIGYLPGELVLDDRLTVDETLRFWATLRGGVEAAHITELCERLSLDRTRSTRGLSSGNRRKVGLVGALMARPDLLVLDEPTSGIDPLVQAELTELLSDVRAEGRTVLLSSHVLSEVQHLADDILLIRRGRTVLTGSVEDLRQRARQPFTVWFGDEPPTDDLQQLAGPDALEVRDRRVSGAFTGSPDPLLQLLARHRVEHLLLPEPDLEDVFLQYYEGEDE